MEKLEKLRNDEERRHAETLSQALRDVALWPGPNTIKNGGPEEVYRQRFVEERNSAHWCS